MSDSIWKKEISFKKKAKPAADPDAFDLPKKSFLKKEISFSRKAKAPAEPEAAEDSTGTKRDDEIERLAQQAVLAVQPVAMPTNPVPIEQPTELAESVVAAMPDLDLPAVDPEPSPLVPLALAPVAPEPEPAQESVAAPWPQPSPAPPAVAPEPWLAEPELPPASAAATTVHPPVPAAELPPLLDKPAKTPFWKKELSLSRKPKAAKPAPVPKEKGVPFWKKELSLGRKPKAAAAEVPTESVAPAAKASPAKPRLSLPKLSLPNLSRGSVKGGRRAKRVVGLKVGASQLAAARISNNGVAELLQLAREPLAQGVVVGGELRDPEALGDALKVFFARHKLSKKDVRLGIASNRIGVRILEISGVEEEKQLANAVQFRAQEVLPIPLDEAVLDYRLLDESVDADGKTVKRVLLVVTYRELIDRYWSACHKAGINLSGIDLEAFGLLRALGAPGDREGSALVAVAIGHDRSTFAVSDGRICEFTRVVEWGGSALNVALARAFDHTPSEVESMKRDLSLDGSTSPGELTQEQTAVALDVVRRQVQSFARELVSSLQFYQNQPGSLGIGEIVLTGGTAHLPGLADELERLIGVHVRVGDPLARLKVGKRWAGTEQIGSLAVAIGLGIED